MVSLELEKFKVEKNGKVYVKNFIPLTYLDLPVELVSDDGSIYMLWINDLEDKELWYIIFINPNQILRYLRGEISARDLIESGETYVGERSYENYFEIKNLIELNSAIKNKLVNKLPTYQAKIKLDEIFYKEIENLIYQNLKKEQITNDLKDIKKFNEINSLYLGNSSICLAING